MNDGALLHEYHTRNHEDSFREIVRRHLSLVRGVALRTLGQGVDAGAAEDVVMRVFAIVARKAAALTGRSSLAGWLVVATRQEAMRHARNARTRSNAMKAYLEERNIEKTAADETAWAEALPHLDAALAALSEADREAVMLRFYEDKNFREISAVLGRGEDAARKRVGAALEKMSGFLRRRDASIPLAVLSVGLATSMKSHAADDAMAIATKALQHAATLTPGAFAGFLQSHPVAACVASLMVIAASVGGGYVAGKSTTPKPTRSLATSNVQKSTSSTNPTLVPRTKAQLVVPKLTLEQLAAELTKRWHQRPQPNEPAYQNLVDTIWPYQCARLVEILDANYRDDFHRHHSIIEDVFRCWAEDEPRAAGDVAIQRWKNGTCELWQTRGLLYYTLDYWGRTDIPAVMEWLGEQELPAATVKSLARTLFGVIADDHPGAAVDMLTAMSWEERQPYLNEFSISEDPTFREDLTETICSIPDEETRAEIFAATLGQLHEPSLAEFQRMKFTQSDAAWSAMQQVADQLAAADHDSRRALDFLWDNAPASARPVICRSHLAELQRKDPAAAVAWMESHQLTPANVQAAVRSLERK